MNCYERLDAILDGKKMLVVSNDDYFASITKDDYGIAFQTLPSSNWGDFYAVFPDAVKLIAARAMKLDAREELERDLKVFEYERLRTGQ